LADPAQPPITRTASDQNVVDLQSRIGEALDQLATLDQSDANNVRLRAFSLGWIFRATGSLLSLIASEKNDEKAESLLAKAACSAWCFAPHRSARDRRRSQPSTSVPWQATRWIKRNRAAEYRHFIRQKT